VQYSARPDLAYAAWDGYTIYMQKKALIIVGSIVAVVLIAGGVTGVLLLAKVSRPTALEPEKTIVTTPSNDETPVTDPSKQSTNVKPDLSVDLGACTAVTQADVKAAVGNAITVNAADNRGYSKEVNGNGVQLCVYAFTNDGSLNNRYTTQVTNFASDTFKNGTKDGISSEAAVIAGISDAAYFSTIAKPADSRTAARTTYSLYVFKGLKLYAFEIAQPGDNDRFTSASAQTALTTIAKSAKF